MSPGRVKGLERVKDQLTRCNACTECYGRGPLIPYADSVDSVPRWICPILDQFKFIAYSARGQQALARKVAYGHMRPDESLKKVFYSCTTCGICDTICPRPVLDTVRAMREQIQMQFPGLYPEAMSERCKKIESKHNFFGADEEARNRWSLGMELEAKADILYFAGCYASYRQPKTAQAVIKLLRAAGLKIAILGGEEWCCGHPAGLGGDWRLEEEMAQHNVERIKKSGAKRVIFSCAECYRAFTVDYPQIVGMLPFGTSHVVEVYEELIREKKLRLQREVRVSVTYHDPCFLVRQHLGRHRDVYKQPRFVIQSVPGISFHEMDLQGRFAYCCGSGGGVTGEVYPKEARWFAKVRARQASERAGLVVTACPRCEESLRHGVRESSVSLKVRDISLLLAEAMGLSSEDRES
jgi:heterodisulfide reductase subunit D